MAKTQKKIHFSLKDFLLGLATTKPQTNPQPTKEQPTIQEPQQPDQSKPAIHDDEPIGTDFKKSL